MSEDSPRGIRTVNAEFNYMLKQAGLNGWQPNCVGQPLSFVMYEGASAPSVRQAREMCSGCPLLELCGEYAKLNRPGWGVWAGRRWAYGRQVGVSHEHAA